MTQGKCSRLDTDCRYRGPEGLKCAIGALIPDDLYDARIEGKAVGWIAAKLFGSKLPWTEHSMLRDILEKAVGAKCIADFEFLASLQRIHDKYFVEEWELQLRRVGRMHELNFPEVTCGR